MGKCKNKKCNNPATTWSGYCDACQEDLDRIRQLNLKDHENNGK